MAVIFVLVSCDGGKGKLPQGFELVANEGRIHFMYVAEYQLGDRVAQREAGRIVCTEIFKQGDYCEIYMWSKKEDIPKSLPIINRRTMVGFYEMKKGVVKLKPLREQNYEPPIYRSE